MHEWILIIIGRNVAEKVRNQMCFIFSPHLTSASALPSKTLEMQKLHKMLYYCITGLQPIASFVTTYANGVVLIGKSRCQ